MAASSPGQDVKDPGYRNWLKVGLALWYMKRSLDSFIRKEVNIIHESLKKEIYRGTTVQYPKCTRCMARDIKQNEHNVWGFWGKSPCQALCHVWLKRLLNMFEDPYSDRIYWNNCDVTSWAYNAWECAKAFMPRGQKQTNTDPRESDHQALLTLMANCKHFHDLLSRSGLQLTRKVSNVRNTTMHAPQMELTDAEMRKYIQEIIDLLDDHICLRHLPECMNAVCNIKKIRDSSVDVFLDLERDLRAMREFHGDAIGNLQNQLGLQKCDLENIHQELVQHMSQIGVINQEMELHKTEVRELSKSGKTVSTCLTKFQENVDNRFSTVQENLQSVESRLNTTQHQVSSQGTMCQRIEENLQSLGGDVLDLQEQIVEINKNSHSQGESRSLMQPTDKDVQSVQQLLIKAYESVQIISISPVLNTAGNWKNIEDFYTDVVIEEAREESTQRKKDKQQVRNEKVTSFRQIFEKANKKVTRIILQAPAGQGKSTFCRKLVHTWCSVQKKKETILIDARVSDKSETNELKAEDEMLRFDVLLYICLRDISDEKTLMDVVYTQFPLHGSQNLSCISHIEALIGQAEGNKVLLIMDGLDEQENSSSFIERLMRKRLYPHLTVLATTRPWKIDQLGLIRSADIDLLLDLQGFSCENSMLYAKRIFVEYYEDESAIARFKQDINNNSIIGSLIHVPLLLLFLIHVWYERKSFPQTIHELYFEILNLIVNRYMDGKERKQNNEGRHDEKKTWSLESMTFILTPKLRNLSLVQHFGEEFLAALCEVANHFLITDAKENSLIIEKNSLVEFLGKDGLSKFQTALDLGILSNSESCSIFRKKICLTFLHKTIQEFLVAINICCREDRCSIFLDSLKTLHNVFQNEMIIMFVAGICTSHCQKIFEKIYELCDKYIDGNYEINYLCRLYNYCIREACKEPISLKLHSLHVYNQEDWNVLQSALMNASDVRTRLKCLHLYECDVTLDLSEFTILTELSLQRVTIKGTLLLSKCTQLKDLNLRNCNLHDATLDLSECASLTKLILVSVTMKGKLLLSKCTQLKDLNLSGCNLDDLTLDLSESTSLTKLSLGTMKGKLLLSKCTQLKDLNLWDCNLDDATLDLSECTSLTKLSLERVTRKGKLLLSKYTQLKDLNLWDCNLDDTTLDLSECTSLTKFSLQRVTMKGKLLLSKCTQLKDLNLSGCNLDDATLDLSECTSLTKFSLERVTMKGKLLLSKCTQLKDLNLCNCNLDDATLDLSERTSLTMLSLCGVTMKGKLLLSKCTQLKDLNLWNCNFYDATLDLSECTSLAKLSLQRGTMKGKLLLSKCTQLEDLNLCNCDLDDATLDLSEYTSLIKLSLVSVTMKGKLLLSKCTHLKDLNLSGCNLDDATLDFSEYTSLAKLSLERVTMKGKLLLSKCTHLRDLNLCNCDLDDDTLDLSECTSLTKLSLQRVTMKGKLLLSKCTHLKDLNLSGCNLDDATSDLSECTSLTKLCLGTMKDKLLLSKCTQLKNLNLCNCDLDDDNWICRSVPV